MGDKVVRLVYLDEAGISNPQHEPFVTVAGVIVNADQQLRDVRRHLEKLVIKHVPASQRDGFICHAKEIFSGGKVIKRDDPYWTDKRRFALADDLAAIPKKFGLRLSFGWVERAKFPQAFRLPDGITEKEKTAHALAVAFLNCAIYVDLWMKKNAKKENCIMIMEDNRDARSLLRDVQNEHQRKSLEKELDKNTRQLLPLKHIQEDPLFQPKRPSSALEIADFCAYIWKRFLMDQKDARYLRFFDPMRSQIVQVKIDPLSPS